MPDKSRCWRGLLAISLGMSLGCGVPDKPGELDTGQGAKAIDLPYQQSSDDGYIFDCTGGNGWSGTSTPTGFTVTWSSIAEDAVCGKGWKTGSGHGIQYSATYTNTGGGSLGVYGWTTSPLAEYYIVEDFGSAGSPGQGTQVGSITSDGGTYTVWKHQQVKQPCVTGDACTFWQFMSVRDSPRTSGTVTVQNHFDAWAQLGMKLGTQSYQLLAVEAWSGSGSANVTLSEVGGGGGGGTIAGGGGGIPIAGGGGGVPVAGGGGGYPIAGGGGGIPVAGGGGGGGIPIGGGGGVAVSSISIDAGSSSAVGTFAADRYYSGGSIYRNNAAIDLSKISGNVPPAVFSSERYGAMTYTIPGRSGTQKVTLYFEESYLSGPGQRRFSVAINGVKVLSDFDIFAAAGGRNKAIARTFDATANSKGQVVIQFVPITQSPKVDALTVTGGGG